MAQTPPPVVIKDYVNPVENTRSQLIHEEKEKIKGKHGFVFNTFKTERQRIDEFMKSKEMERNSSIINNLNLIPLKSEPSLMVMGKTTTEETFRFRNQQNQSSQPNFLQPTMRFKPRTDMERIFDQIEKNQPWIQDRKILKKQLSKLELNKVKESRKKEEEDEEEFNPFFIELNKFKTRKDRKEPTIDLINSANEDLFIDKDLDKDIYHDNINTNLTMNNTVTNLNTSKMDKSTSKYFKRKQVDNSKSKELFKHLYYKTHFKGAIDLATHSKFHHLFINLNLSSPKDNKSSTLTLNPAY